jgi:hypothetical protein
MWSLLMLESCSDPAAGNPSVGDCPLSRCYTLQHVRMSCSGRQPALGIMSDERPSRICGILKVGSDHSQATNLALL